jgi:hypothetical protein
MAAATKQTLSNFSTNKTSPLLAKPDLLIGLRLAQERVEPCVGCSTSAGSPSAIVAVEQQSQIKILPSSECHTGVITHEIERQRRPKWSSGYALQAGERKKSLPNRALATRQA